jgi:hypothetical protein
MFDERRRLKGHIDYARDLLKGSLKEPAKNYAAIHDLKV